MNNKGFVKLPRDVTNKPWYNHNGTLRVYIELLINAAWNDFEYNGSTLKRGQFITSIGKLAERCQLSVQQTRTALSHLKSTNTITINTTSKFSIITVLDDIPDDESNNPADNLANNQSNTPVNNRNRREEKENKIEIKEKEREETPSPSFNSFDSSITRDALTKQYGIENVICYERKLFQWKESKGITGSFDDLKTIAKWLDEDSVKKPRGSLFNMEDVKQRLVSRYK
ncbi:MAG: hypothetical protein OSJ43_02190 [Oscillospiraceae bacterium]|nr:hypothetical protein [Oscillospiraceae bacterium]